MEHTLRGSGGRQQTAVQDLDVRIGNVRSSMCKSFLGCLRAVTPRVCFILYCLEWALSKLDEVLATSELECCALIHGSPQKPTEETKSHM